MRMNVLTNVQIVFQWLNAMLEVLMEIYYGCVTCACFLCVIFFPQQRSVAFEAITELATHFCYSHL